MAGGLEASRVISDNRFMVLKYRYAREGTKRRLWRAFYRVMVYLYYLRVKSRLAWNLTVSRLCCGVVWYCGKIARLDVWRWYCGLWAGLVAVDSLSWWAVDRLKGLWISKGKTRVRELYPKKIIPKRTSVLCPWPAIFNTIFYHFQIKKWKLFSSKKIG